MRPSSCADCSRHPYCGGSGRLGAPRWRARRCCCKSSCRGSRHPAPSALPRSSASRLTPSASGRTRAESIRIVPCRLAIEPELLPSLRGSRRGRDGCLRRPKARLGLDTTHLLARPIERSSIRARGEDVYRAVEPSARNAFPRMVRALVTQFRSGKVASAEPLSRSALSSSGCASSTVCPASPRNSSTTPLARLGRMRKQQ